MAEYVNLRGRRVVLSSKWDGIEKDFEGKRNFDKFLEAVYNKTPSQDYREYQILKLLSSPGEKCLVKPKDAAATELKRRGYIQSEPDGRCSITPRGAECLQEVDTFLERYGDFFKLEI